jgi:hypothetical protein
MTIAMRERKHHGSQYHRKLMSKCHLEDFVERGIEFEDKESEMSRLVRFCPHIDTVEEPWYKVRNDYTNDKLRNSFSVEILSCLNKTPGFCKSKEEV